MPAGVCHPWAQSMARANGCRSRAPRDTDMSSETAREVHFAARRVLRAAPQTQGTLRPHGAVRHGHAQ
eukprot:2107548-Prymnesium_polylepis.1